MRYLVLKVPSVRPTYVFTSALSSLVTVAWYTTPSVKHFPDSGQVSFLRQLQSWVFVAGFHSASLVSTDLLCDEMMLEMLGMQL